MIILAKVLLQQYESLLKAIICRHAVSANIFTDNMEMIHPVALMLDATSSFFLQNANLFAACSDILRKKHLRFRYSAMTIF